VILKVFNLGIPIAIGRDLEEYCKTGKKDRIQ
jgi:hypothetical protein